MNTLNLINKEKSDISYEIITFPDGEPHIKIIDLDRKEDVHVVCRISNPTDLFILMQVGNILNRQGIIFTIEIRYLMSMRMDRVMSFGEAYSLEIVSAMINSLNAKKVYIYEPHSSKTIDLIKNSIQKIRNVDYKENYTIIFPDNGAATRYHAELYRDIIFQKKRNLSDGRIISLEPVNKDLLFKTDKPFLIVDDLCDGGMTFKLIAEYLDKVCPGHKRDINIIHMVNPKGIQTLSAHYDNVYITETYKNWSKEDLPSNVFVSEI